MKFIKFKKFFALILIILVKYLVIHHFYTRRQYLKSECSRNSAIIITESFNEIPRDMMTNQTIYFLETHNSSDHELTARQACAIESAAYMNPHVNIFVLFLTPSNHIRLKNLPQYREIFEYKNIHLRFFHIEDIIDNTRVTEWLSGSDVMRNSKWKILHLSDMLRYTLLYKYSGVYLDLDVIVRRPLSEIALANFVCFEDMRWWRQSANNAIIALRSEVIARKIGRLLLDGVMDNYDGKQWSIGPRLMTKALKSYCNTTSLIASPNCDNFTILHKDKCYAIEGNHWNHFYKESRADRVMEKVKDSFFVHLWNFQSGNKKIETHRQVAFNLLAEEHCPRVFRSNDYI